MGDEQAVARQIDEINNAASQGQVALTQYASTLTDNDMALKAYIASLDGGQASIAGFNQFIQQHNIQVKASGIAAKAAAVGHALLNAAISMGISLIISAAISAITKLINKHIILLITNDGHFKNLFAILSKPFYYFLCQIVD